MLKTKQLKMKTSKHVTKNMGCHVVIVETLFTCAVLSTDICVCRCKFCNTGFSLLTGEKLCGQTKKQHESPAASPSHAPCPPRRADEAPAFLWRTGRPDQAFKSRFVLFAFCWTTQLSTIWYSLSCKIITHKINPVGKLTSGYTILTETCVF